MIHKEDVFLIGKLTKAHGLRGEINFQFTNDIWERADSDYLICEVDGILVPFFIEEYRFRSDSTALIKFEDLDNSDAVQMLVNSTGGTGYIHESVNKDNDRIFSRAWFAWANSLFAYLILEKFSE